MGYFSPRRASCVGPDIEDWEALELASGRDVGGVCDGVSVKFGVGCCIGWFLRRGDGIRDDRGVELLALFLLGRSEYGGVRILSAGEGDPEHALGGFAGTLISNSEP